MTDNIDEFIELIGEINNHVDRQKQITCLLAKYNSTLKSWVFDVPGKPGFWWVRPILGGEPFAAFNKAAPMKPGLEVIVEPDINSGRLCIVDIIPDSATAYNPQNPPLPVPPIPTGVGSGREQYNSASLIADGLVYAQSGMVIAINRFTGNFNQTQQTYTPGSFDLTSLIPGAGLHGWVLVGIDPNDGTIQTAATTPVVLSVPLLEADLTALVFGDNIPLAAIQLTNGMTALSFPTNFVDRRAWITGQWFSHPLQDQFISVTLANHTIIGGTIDGAIIGGSDPEDITAENYRFKAGTLLTISSDAITITQSYHTLESELGTTDNLATINGGVGVQDLTIQADADDTITVKHGTGNIFLNGGTDFSLSGDKSLRLFYDGTNWSDTGAGGGGTAFYQTVQDTGVDQTQRGKLDFVGATITDDAGNDRTIVTLAGGGSNITKTTKTFYQRTVLYDNTLSSAGTWDVSSIDQTYDHLELIFSGRATVSTGGVGVESVVSLNNDSTSSNYTRVQVFGSVGGAVGASNDNIRGLIYIPDSSSLSDRFTDAVSTIQDYTLSKSKVIVSVAGLPLDNLNNQYADLRVVTWKSTAAINRVALAVDNATNTFVTGSRLQIIGIKQEDVVTDISGTGTVQFTQTATVTVSNTTAETTLIGSGVGSTTFGANALNAVGRTVRLKMWGILSDLGALPGNLTIKLKLGSTVLVTSGAVALVAGLTNALWELEFVATVRTTGATGTIMTNGVMRIVSALADTVEPLTNGTSTITIDFTGSLVIDVTATFSTASASNAITSLNGVLEVLN